MKLTAMILISLVGILFSGCSYSNDNREHVGNSIQKIGPKDISQCISDDINFCIPTYIEQYNKHSKDKANFSNDKILLLLDHFRSTGKGEDRHIKLIVVLDPKNNKVYPLPQYVGNFLDDRLNQIVDEPPIVNFSKNKNTICLSGTTFAKNDNNINVENECFTFSDGNFLNVEKIKNKLINNVKTISLPASSDSYDNCMKKKLEKECNKLSNENDYTYSYINILNFENSLGYILKQQKIKELDVDTIRFIPNDKAITYAIGQKQFEYGNNDDVTINYYLLKLSPKIEVILLGEKYSIDKNYLLSYIDKNMKNKIISVK